MGQTSGRAQHRERRDPLALRQHEGQNGYRAHEGEGQQEGYEAVQLVGREAHEIVDSHGSTEEILAVPLAGTLESQADRQHRRRHAEPEDEAERRTDPALVEGVPEEEAEREHDEDGAHPPQPALSVIRETGCRPYGV